MSLVGPRPEVPEIVDEYTPEQRKRLDMPPGVTGLAQINGRSELALIETLTYDLEYVRTWSFGLDLKILWKTVFVVFAGMDAYLLGIFFYACFYFLINCSSLAQILHSHVPAAQLKSLADRAKPQRIMNVNHCPALTPGIFVCLRC
jgi:hypothetical protein